MTKTLTNKEMNKYFGNLEDHEYRHYNRSLGCFVEGKEHFRKLLSDGKFVPFELAQQYAEDYDKRNPRKEYILSNKAHDIINSVKLTADKHGNIKLGGRAIQALKEIGAIPSETVQEQLEYIYREDRNIKGGFSKQDNGSFAVPLKSSERKI